MRDHRHGAFARRVKLLKSLVKERKDQPLEQKAVVRAHPPRDLAEIHPEPLRRLLHIGTNGGEAQAFLDDQIAIGFGGRDDDREALPLQRLPQRDEGIKIAERSESGDQNLGQRRAHVGNSDRGV